MSRFLLAGLTLLLTALQPLNAYAYLTPEDVMNEDDLSTRFLAPPPSRRSMQDVQQAQRERSALQREEGLEEAKRESGSLPEEEENMHGAAPEESEEQTDIQKLIEALERMEAEEGGEDVAEEDTSSLDPRDERLLERLKEQQEQERIRKQYAAYMANSDGNMHSGAPLSDTGPATVITVLAVAAAIGETWRRVRKTNTASTL